MWPSSLRNYFHQWSYRWTCSTMSLGAEKTLTGVRLVTFCSRASCWMPCMICCVCLTPTFTAWQKSCCSTFSAEASIITVSRHLGKSCTMWMNNPEALSRKLQMTVAGLPIWLLGAPATIKLRLLEVISSLVGLTSNSPSTRPTRTAPVYTQTVSD